MIPIEITYLNASAETEWNKKKGSFVDIAYEADLTSLPEEIRRFSFLENILFRMEWKEFVDGDEWLITKHEISPFPERIIVANGHDKIVGKRKTFLNRKTFLDWEEDFFNLANLFVRVSLTPVLAAKRQSIDMERLTGYYRLIPKTIGSPPMSPITPSVIY